MDNVIMEAMSCHILGIEQQQKNCGNENVYHILLSCSLSITIVLQIVNLGLKYFLGKF